MTNPAFAVWQISGGPASRAYAEVFLRHGVALIGPGDAGPWNPERDDDDFESGLGSWTITDFVGGTHTLSTDEMTGIQALERIAPTNRKDRS